MHDSTSTSTGVGGSNAYSPSTTYRYELAVLLPDDWKGRIRYRLIFPLYLAGVNVPDGFVTDGASVPRWAWPVFPPVGRYFAAAVVHDYVLSLGLDWPAANDLFRRALVELEIAGWRLRLLVGAVRVYGVWRRLLEMKHIE